MDAEKFIDFIDQRGIEYRLTDESIILNEAPCCGGQKKIYLFREGRPGQPLFGKCYKCDTTWSSWTYLREMGYDLGEIGQLHGESTLTHTEATDSLGSLDLLEPVGTVVTKETKPVSTGQVFLVSHFYTVPEMPDSEAAAYAIKRGWTPAQLDTILIDHHSNSVVFVCYEGEAIIGYQRRFLHPVDPKNKTKTVQGFKKTQHIMEYANKGDIMVCEGPFTALSAWHYGFHAVCTFGAGVSEKQAELVKQLAISTGKSVGTAFDLDVAGRKGYKTLATALYWEGVPVYKIRPETGNDLNDSWQAGKGYVRIDDNEDLTIPDLKFGGLI